MKIDEKFNKRGANLITLSTTTVHSGPQYAEGVCVTFGEPIDFTTNEGGRDLRLHMTPDEAMELAIELLHAARRMLSSGSAA